MLFESTQVAENDLIWENGYMRDKNSGKRFIALGSSAAWYPLLQLCESLVNSVIHTQLIIHIELMNESLTAEEK